MLKWTSILCLALVFAAGCEQANEPFEAQPVAISQNLVGTEMLGDPGIPIADGSGIVEGGTGMISQPGTIDIDVPGDVEQVLVYWSGGDAGGDPLGDPTIEIDGVEITGTLIGGPVNFFENYQFTAYRADVTAMNIVSPGANSFAISGMDYTFQGGEQNNENNGVSMVVIYDDGTSADIQLRDGLDTAHWRFTGDLQVTVPQTFDFTPATEERTAHLTIVCGSVGVERPNEILVTIDGVPQSFFDLLGSNDGPLWDSLIIPVTIPADASSLTVEIISTESLDPLGASLTWVTAGLAVPEVEELPAALGDYVWHDMDRDGIQDDGEPGVEGVVVHLLDCQGTTLDETMTDIDGLYLFADLMPGDYNVHFMLPDGYEFTLQNAGPDDVDSDADPVTGMTECTNLVAGETDLTWDAGIFMPDQEGCTHTIGYWKTHAGFGPQDDEVTPLLPIWLGDEGGDKSLAVTDAQIAVDVLEQHTYGRPSNGITKLYAQLLGAKLSIASGASGDAVADAIADADAFLADHDWHDWNGLSGEEKDMVRDWKDMFDYYNNGDIGPGHCDEEEEEPDHGKRPLTNIGD